MVVFIGAEPSPYFFYKGDKMKKELAEAVVNTGLERLYNTIYERKTNPKAESYSCKLLENSDYLLEKIAEESAEVIESAKLDKRSGKDSIVWEVSDLLYFLTVLLVSKGISLDEVYEELERRRK